MQAIFYILFIFLILFCFLLLTLLLVKKKKQILENNDIKEKNLRIILENENLEKQRTKLEEELDKTKSDLINQKTLLLNSIKEETNLKYQEEQKAIQEKLELHKNISDKAFESYFEELEKHYNKVAAEHDEKIRLSQEQVALIKNELEEMKKAKQARIAAHKREKEIAEQAEFYKLKVSKEDLSEIKIIEGFKDQLRQPVILDKLIWTTYFQKPMTALCNQVLGAGVICGIYKLTNQVTGEVYIGQSVDVATRWKDHCKCGLGINTQLSNKLYKAMNEYGVWNFTWELLEKVEKPKLNEKELYYIDFYQSKEFGYNLTKGNM